MFASLDVPSMRGAQATTLAPRTADEEGATHTPAAAAPGEYFLASPATLCARYTGRSYAVSSSCARSGRRRRDQSTSSWILALGRPYRKERVELPQLIPRTQHGPGLCNRIPSEDSRMTFLELDVSDFGVSDSFHRTTSEQQLHSLPTSAFLLSKGTRRTCV